MSKVMSICEVRLCREARTTGGAEGPTTHGGCTEVDACTRSTKNGDMHNKLVRSRSVSL